MLIVKVGNDKNIERALKQYKSKIIKTRQMTKLNEGKEFIKPSVKKRNVFSKAKHVNKIYNKKED